MGISLSGVANWFWELRHIEAATLLVYSGGYLLIVFLSICIATGLYYISELVEECSQMAKRVITWTVEATLLMYGLLWLRDGLPLPCIAAGAAAQVAYLRLLRKFPFFRIMSVDTALAAGLFLAANIGWWRWHFRQTWHSLEYVFGFYLMAVWLVPFALFTSLAANEQTLPGGPGGALGCGSGGGGRGKSTKSFLLSMFDLLKAKRDEWIPQANAAKRATLKPHTV